MAEMNVTQTLDTTPDAVWRCVSDFGNLSWIPGGVEAKVRGDGVGQLRIIERPNSRVQERLTSLDNAARRLTYVVDEGMPLPVTDYVATVTVSDDGGKGRLSWSGRFEPDGMSEEEIIVDLEKRFGRMIRWIGKYLKEQG